jgi:hypothetical protein
MLTRINPAKSAKLSPLGKWVSGIVGIKGFLIRKGIALRIIPRINENDVIKRRFEGR